MDSGRLKYFLAAIGSAVIWGFVSVCVRNLQAFPAPEILYFRVFISLAVSSVIILFFRKEKITADLLFLRREAARSRRKLLWLTVLAGILITGNWFFYIYVVNNISLQSAAFAYMICPLIAAFGGFLILKEHLSNLKLAGIAIAMLSIVILAQGSFQEVMWSALIAMFYGFYIITQRVIKNIDKFNLLAVQFLISSLLIAPFFIYQHSVIPADAVFWINIIIISVVFTIIPLFLNLYALTVLPSSTLGMIIYITPIVAFAVAFVYFHEQINVHQVIAYILLLTAVIIFNGELINQIFFKKAKQL